MNFFEPEKLMKRLSGNIIIPKFGECNEYHNTWSKSELILFWILDIVDVYKKETQLLIDSGDLYIFIKLIE